MEKYFIIIGNKNGSSIEEQINLVDVEVNNESEIPTQMVNLIDSPTKQGFALNEDEALRLKELFNEWTFKGEDLEEEENGGLIEGTEETVKESGLLDNMYTCGICNKSTLGWLDLALNRSNCKSCRKFLKQGFDKERIVKINQDMEELKEAYIEHVAKAHTWLENPSVPDQKTCVKCGYHYNEQPVRECK